ncbi:MAG: DUF3987 domain-containing protein [Syntrophobacteraceae bacterium]
MDALLSLIRPLPEALGARLNRPIEPKDPERKTPACPLDDPDNVMGAIEYVQSPACPISVENSGGNNAAYKLAAFILDKFALSKETGVDVLWRFWNDRCVPPWSYKELRTVVHNSYEYSQNRIGANSPQAILKLLPEIDEPGEFPVSVLSGLAGDFSKLYSEYMEPPIQFLYFSFLTCLGTVLADRITLDSQLKPSPRLYTLILGQSADDRKSTAISQTQKFFREALSIVLENSLSVCHGVGSAEGLQKRLAQNNKLLLSYDEFKQFVSKCRIEASALLPAVVTLYESNTYENFTKKSQITIHGAHLSILAACTLDTFQAMWTSAFTDIGLNNRLFLVTGAGERRFSIPREIPEEQIQALASRLREIVSGIPDQKVYRIEPPAFKLFDHWYLNLPKSIHAKRLDTMAMRLMVLLAANEQRESIDQEITAKALKLVNWQREVRERVDPIDADSQAARLEEKIRRCLARKPSTERELKQAVNANRCGLWLYDQAKKNLLTAKEIVFQGRIKKFMLVGEEKV